MAQQDFVDKRTRYILPKVSLAVGIVTVAVGLSMLRNNPMTTIAVSPTNNFQQPYSTRPSEDKPTEDMAGSYTVAVDMPRSIRIDKIGVNALIQPVGLDKSNAIAVPVNIHFVGWYTSSIKPGQTGLSILNGHVSGVTSDGVFKNLNKLAKNDTITIEYGDKSLVGFKVDEIITVPEPLAAEALFKYKNNQDAQLNIITCTGKFNSNTQKYEDRIIVVAKKL